MKSASIKHLSGLELHITAWSLATSNPKPQLHDYKQSDSLAAYILVIVRNTVLSVVNDTSPVLLHE